MLGEVQGRAVEHPLVERSEVPEIEVEDPERERDQGVPEEAKPAEPADAEDRLEHRPGEAQRDPERGQVADQEVLGHVGNNQLLRQPGDRRHIGDQQDQQAKAEAELPPPRHRLAPSGEGGAAADVGDCDREQGQRGQELDHRSGA